METRGSKSDALKREWEMKKLTRQEKLNLTKTYRPSSLSVDM
jgi:predicted GIY-YIG superfamily endonuclease